MPKRLLAALLTAFLLGSHSILSAEIKLSSQYGDVKVLRDGNPVKAAPGSALNVKDKIVTGDSSRAVLTMDGATRIWVARNSSMEITSTGSQSLFNLLAGKIRAKVKLLAGGDRKFSVKTPVSVASVRGTEFIANTDGLLAVIEGKVDFSDIDMKKTVEVLAGYLSEMGKAGQPDLPRGITEAEQRNLENEWGDFSGMEQGVAPANGQEKKEQTKEQKELAEMRTELRQTISNIKDGVNKTREITNNIKEADIATGRTLRDVHGNVVRVEQYLLRPAQDTFELLNLTKRTEYKYSDRNNWGFQVDNKPRLDIADIKITMNMGLPEQLTEWPSFISAKGDDLHPDRIHVMFTNQADTIQMRGRWGLRGIDRDERGNLLKEDRIVTDTYINDWLVDDTYISPDTGSSFPKEGSDPDELYAWDISARQKLVKPGFSDRYVYIYSEMYGINNDGKILSLNDFTSSSDNPFIVLKQVAGESIMFVRNSDAGRTSFLRGGNLDLVVTPDMIVTIAQKLASQLGELTDK